MSATLADSLPPALPHPMEVERLAVVLAAAVGQYWMAIDDEAKSNYRVMANQALFLLGVEAHATGLGRVRRAIEEMGATMRRAADKLEEMKGDEYTIAKLHLGSNNCDGLLMILDAMPEAPEEDADAPEQLSDFSGQLEEEEVV